VASGKKGVYTQIPSTVADVDRIFTLALYLSTAFTKKQSRGRKLFLGSASSQSGRAADILKRVLKENEDKVLQMGYDSLDDIGLHSIRKGAASYLASLPGGPSPAAICLRGGWPMGQIKDTYFHLMQSGDQFTGRCASLLNMFHKDFAASPVVFDSAIEESWLDATVQEVFPAFVGVEGMQPILRMCLASLVYHRESA
jgi:hypothetical protein